MRNAKTLQTGFTLVELLVVVVLIAVLSGGVFMLMRASNTKEGIARTTASVQALASLVETYHNQYGAYPRVTAPSGTDGYAPVNFTFRTSDAGSCRYCGNKSSQDRTNFGLCAHFVPRISIIRADARDSEKEDYEDWIQKPSIAKEDSDGANAWELEYGDGMPNNTLDSIARDEGADGRLQAIYAVWMRLNKDGFVYGGVKPDPDVEYYDGESFCQYCGTGMFNAGVDSDAWGNALLYSNDGGVGVIVSKGPDGVLGTADDIRSDGGRTSTDDDEE